MKLQNIKSKIKGLRSAKSGMSLPELITVVVLMAIIGAAAISYVVAAAQEAKAATVKTNCNNLAAYLNQAEAMGATTGIAATVTGAAIDDALLQSWGIGLPVPNTAILLKFQANEFHNSQYLVDHNGSGYAVRNPAGIP